MGFKDAGKPHFLGHRDRLRQRFRDSGGDTLPDYELLELVLFRALPRRDTKPLAKELIAKFGSFPEVVNAPGERLAEVSGVGDSVITEMKLIRSAALRLMKGQAMDRPVLGSWSAVLSYCRAAMGFETKEQSASCFLTSATGSLPTRFSRKAQSAIRLSMSARSSNAPWNSPPPQSSWCTTTLPVTRHLHAPISR